MHGNSLWTGLDADRVAPLTPNAWLRFDLVGRMLPRGAPNTMRMPISAVRCRTMVESTP